MLRLAKTYALLAACLIVACGESLTESQFQSTLKKFDCSASSWQEISNMFELFSKDMAPGVYNSGGLGTDYIINAHLKLLALNKSMAKACPREVLETCVQDPADRIDDSREHPSTRTVYVLVGLSTLSGLSCGPMTRAT